MELNYQGAKIGFSERMFEGEIVPELRDLTYVARDTIVATTTLYKAGKDGNMSESDRIRSDLTLETVRNARNLGFTIAILDGGSAPEWRNKVKEMGGILVDEDLDRYSGHHFMGRGRRQILDFAGNYGNHKVVLWTEPEKHTFFRPEGNAVSPAYVVATAVYTDVTDVAVGRREDNLASYQLQQQLEELLGNVHVMEQMRSYIRENNLGDANQMVPYLDLWIGPRAISKENSLDRFLNYPGAIKVFDTERQMTEIVEYPHDRWEVLFVPPWMMMLAGERINSVAVDYVHPQVQTKLEQGDPVFNQKRIDQFNTLITAQERLLKSHKQGLLKF